MTTLTQATSTNVETTLNVWMQTALEAFELPQWMPNLPAIVANVPETTAVMPCFSFIHIPVGASSPWEGRWAGTSKGSRVSGILDVSCWVSRSASPDWLMQIRTMRDMALSAAVGTPVVVISDYYAETTNTVAPVIVAPVTVGVLVAGDDGVWADALLTTPYKINIRDVTLTATLPDENPDVERARVLIDYDYVFRTS